MGAPVVSLRGFPTHRSQLHRRVIIKPSGYGSRFWHPISSLGFGLVQHLYEDYPGICCVGLAAYHLHKSAPQCRMTPCLHDIEPMSPLDFDRWREHAVTSWKLRSFSLSPDKGLVGPAYSLHCSSFFWFNQICKSILRIPKGNPQKELQWRHRCSSGQASTQNPGSKHARQSWNELSKLVARSVRPSLSATARVGMGRGFRVGLRAGSLLILMGTLE